MDERHSVLILGTLALFKRLRQFLHRKAQKSRWLLLSRKLLTKCLLIQSTFAKATNLMTKPTRCHLLSISIRPLTLKIVTLLQRDRSASNRAEQIKELDRDFHLVNMVSLQAVQIWLRGIKLIPLTIK